MKAASFFRHVPKTVEEAVALLAEFAPQDGRVLAGGQSLVPIMAFRLARPAHLIDINEVASLDKLTIEGDRLVIGACVRHAAFHKPDVPGPLGQLLATVVRNIAHYPIRMRGTMCGSLAHADPASEWCLTAATLDAELVARKKGGKRVIPAAEFFHGIMTTALAEDELLAEVRFLLLPNETKFGFQEFSRRAGDFAMAASLTTFRLEGGKITDAHVGVGGAEAAPRRIAEAEAVLNGKKPDDVVFDAAANAAAAAVDPLDDAQIPPEYRRELVQAMVYRALQSAA
ncbi:MAG TPA: FAD binding domain-containing protein [Xanthobacteraceae bacterium]|jgi:carbon-monoxide dehydrogenase medium subunit|nr:FAD binding domain-containing protein [Xanthobacteraceae bacterium]